MRQIYSAEHPTEAHMVKGILETNGIECEVRGDTLFGARGELPLTMETAPSVWVVDEKRYKDARRIIQQYEAANAGELAAGEKWNCSACGEILESQFTHCWQCGKARYF